MGQVAQQETTMKARDIMTADPFTVTPTDSVRRTADIMRELSVGAVPVVEDPDAPVLRGIITDRDITIRCTAEGHSPFCPVGDHMTPMPLQTVEPDTDVTAVIERMERAQVRRLPVVAADGTLLGIIAQADLATKLGPREPRLIEELLERISATSVPV
jgi:CBS domain-containing protein